MMLVGPKQDEKTVSFLATNQDRIDVLNRAQMQAQDGVCVDEYNIAAWAFGDEMVAAGANAAFGPAQVKDGATIFVARK